MQAVKPRVMLANDPGELFSGMAGEAGAAIRLDASVIVITLSGKDLARLQAALQMLIELGKGELYAELMPLLIALGNIE